MGFDGEARVLFGSYGFRLGVTGFGWEARTCTGFDWEAHTCTGFDWEADRRPRLARLGRSRPVRTGPDSPSTVPPEPSAQSTARCR